MSRLFYKLSFTEPSFAFSEGRIRIGRIRIVSRNKTEEQQNDNDLIKVAGQTVAVIIIIAIIMIAYKKQNDKQKLEDFVLSHITTPLLIKLYMSPRKI